jgi:AraC-like DNA-binding protein
MKQEYEIVQYPHIKYINIFLNQITYRTPHIHSDIEIALILDGELELNTKLSHQTMSKGSMFILNPNEPHEYITKNNSVLMLFLQISPLFFMESFPEITHIIYNCIDLGKAMSAQTFEKTYDLLTSLSKSYFTKDDGYKLKCCQYIYHMFYTFYTTLPNYRQTQDELRNSHSKASRLRRILDYITNHFTENIKLSDLAEIEHLSSSYLSHFIKDNLNITFQQYVNSFRLNYALELISHSDLRLIDISAECGYSDYRYFHNAFIKVFSCSPSQYKKKNQSIPHHKQKSNNNILEIHFSNEESIKHLQNFMKK